MKLNTVLIIEDEQPNADRLKRLLLQLRPHLEILSVEDSIASSVSWLKKNQKPDLIMMDIRLSDGLSFEIFNWVTVSSFVIFTTAFDEYAVKAFKYNSIDYLLKPIDSEELKAALIRFENLLIEQPIMPTALEGLVDYLQPKNYRKRFLLAYKDGYKTILTENILYFQSEWGATQAMLKNGCIEAIPQTLEDLEKQLDPKCFFRANRQFIVHIDAVKRVLNHFNGKLKLEIQHQETGEILVSREKAPAFKAWMDF